jgi:hypothetical protein
VADEQEQLTDEELAEAAARLKPWEQRPDETTLKYVYFCTYRDLPYQSRSVAEAYRAYHGMPPGVNVPAGWWIELSKTYQWASRARAYDAFVLEQRRKALEELDRTHTLKLIDHARAFRNNQVACAFKALARAHDILSMPLETEEVRELRGGKMTVYIREAAPPNLLLAAANLMNVGSKIGRQGLGLKDDDDGPPATVNEWKRVMYKSASAIEQALPAGAVQPVPEQVAIKPAFHNGGGDVAGSNGNGNGHSIAPLKGDRERP